MAGNAILSHDIPRRKISSHRKNPLKTCREIDSLTVPSHPLKIKPGGNAYTATVDIKLAAGSFNALPDDVLVQLLEFLDATSLKRLGFACKALYAFSRHEELWKTLCIEYESFLSNYFFMAMAPRYQSVHHEICCWGLH